MNASLDEASEVGPQYSGDDPFTRRMRLHQSWWRAAVLRVECGVGPHATSRNRYGNMLTERDGVRGLNFLTPAIAEFAVRRQQEFPRGIKRHRLLCNMLSSQPMCFNLFGPAALDEEVGCAIAAACCSKFQLHRCVRVIIEHEPAPRSAFLDDATSFDAFLELEDISGRLGFLAIETKLTEPFSPTRYAIAEGSRYSYWLRHARSPWDATSSTELEAIDINQLFRNHALAVAAAHREDTPYSFGMLGVVRHPGDAACAAAVSRYRHLVRDDGLVPLIDLPLDAIVERLRPVISGTNWAAWLDAFEQRYVDLTGSSGLAR